MSDLAPDDVVIDEESSSGYRRSPAAQDAFDAAAAALLQSDGWPDPTQGGVKRLVADLALEGGGVKGIGLVGAVLVLSEAGYGFRGVAGTSAGAIGATLIAAISATEGRTPMTALRGYLGSLQFSNFMPEGKVHQFLDHHGGKVGALAADAAVLTQRMGVYPGDYLEKWLAPILHDDLGVRSFGDLKLSATSDPGMSLPAGHDYRLVVHVSDITRGELVRLPWDYPLYGYDRRDEQDVIKAVRASMSIPFFFEPVTFTSEVADVDVLAPDGGTIRRHYDAGTVTWVDGGMLRNFPIGAFDRVDGAPPRWPTIGIKLSSLQTAFPASQACESSLAVGLHCVRTMMNEWDSYAVDETTAARTIFVDNGGLTATQFDLSKAQQDMLFLNGVRAATAFVIEMAEAKGVPRSPDAALVFARRRRTRSPTQDLSTVGGTTG
jgi:NTE family protein